MMSVEKKIRVLIVDDSAFMRKVLREIVSSDPALEVIGEGCDGRQAVALAESLNPDVISMDINMPYLDGLGATEVIMSRNPHPIVIVSSESREGAKETLRALELGAVDFVTKVSGAIDLNMKGVRDELTRKLKMAAKVRVIRTATRTKTPQAISPPRLAAAGESAGGEQYPLVILAASTGGPATLMKLVPNFRKGIPAALVLALHMPASFTRQFAQQLADVSAIPVKEAEAGEALRPGTLHVCPGAYDLRIGLTGHIVLDDGPRISSYRPWADVTMETAAVWAGPMAIGVILTGMGNDGSRGALAMKAAGGYVIAQDEATSMIFGMPQEAIRTGAVNEVPGRDSKRSRKANHDSGESRKSGCAVRTGRREAAHPAPASRAIILFWVGVYRMAIWAEDVKEIRNDFGLAAAEIGCRCILYAHTLFNVTPGQDARLVVLRSGDVGVGVDRVERMIESGAPRPLPQAFQGAERQWYLGLVHADGALVPLVNPETLEREAIRQEVEICDAAWALSQPAEAI